MLFTHIVVLTAALLALPVAAQVSTPEFDLTIKDHKFEPAELHVPAGQKFKLVVKNMDKSAAEFESKPLKREKVIQGGASATILLGPLKAGSYPFVEEYHEDVTKGVIIAK